MYCRTCGTQLAADVAVCTNCGVRPMMGKQFCNSCGNATVEQAVVCVKCGVALRSASEKSKSTAGILALFLGGLGAHKFYLGDTVMGIMYILFCWTFIPAIVGAIEGLIYLTMSDDSFAQKYGK